MQCIKKKKEGGSGKPNCVISKNENLRQMKIRENKGKKAWMVEAAN